MSAYTPFTMQNIFHQCPAIERFLGGAAGPGKTRALMEEVIDACRTLGQVRAIYFRKTMDELQKVIDDSKLIIPLYCGNRASYNENLHRWTFHDTGSYLRFDSLHKEDAVTSHLSEEYDIIAMDECGQMSDRMMRFMRTRMRTVIDDEEGERRRALWIGASNPGGQGHMELLRRYVDPQVWDARLLYWWDKEEYETTGYGWVAYPAGTIGKPQPFDVWQPPEDDEMKARNAERIANGVEPMQPNSRCFIPGRLEDNPILYNSPDYDATLWELASGDPKLYRAMREGDWTAFSGQVFSEFSPEHHVILPIIPHAAWLKWRSVDWGYSKPCAIYWHTYDPSRDLIITYRELYLTLKQDRELCDAIKESTPGYERSPSGLWRTIVDPNSFWQRLGQDDTLNRAVAWERHGVPVEPGNNNRSMGKRRIHELLALRPEYDNLPGWQITMNCDNLIRTLPTLTYDTKKPEDVDTTGEDHAYDSCRYGLQDLATIADEWGPGMTRSVPLRARQ